ncbi:hypothetical protein VNI00_013375 [Paramarasmius palmivorus]|uniref:Uncharacterized protein n=1 Tax=Paramarasmius palmivorus TaxID=297713 RepID=A0AAW0C0X6_9AGAR
MANISKQRDALNMFADSLVDTFHQALVSYVAYTCVISNYGNASIFEELLWSELLIILTNVRLNADSERTTIFIYQRQAIVAVVTQLAMIRRLWRVRYKGVSVTVAMLPLICSSLGTTTAYYILWLSSLSKTTRVDLRMVFRVANILNMVSNITITLSIGIYIWTGYVRTDRSLAPPYKILRFCALTGMFATLSAALAMILTLTVSDTLAYVGLYFVIARLYTGSFFAVINDAGEAYPRPPQQAGASSSSTTLDFISMPSTSVRLPDRQSVRTQASSSQPQVDAVKHEVDSTVEEVSYFETD